MSKNFSFSYWVIINIRYINLVSLLLFSRPISTWIGFDSIFSGICSFHLNFYIYRFHIVHNILSFNVCKLYLLQVCYSLFITFCLFSWLISPEGTFHVISPSLSILGSSASFVPYILSICGIFITVQLFSNFPYIFSIWPTSSLYLLSKHFVSDF